MTQDTIALVDSTRTGLLSGSIEVFRGPITDNAGTVRIAAGDVGDIDKLLGSDDWLVNGVTGQIG